MLILARSTFTLALALISGCAATPRRGLNILLQREMCAPPLVSEHAPPARTEPLDAEAQEHVSQRFSRTSRDVGDVIGASSILAHIASLERQGDSTELASERARLALRIDLAELAVRSVVAELICEHERMMVAVESLRSAEESSTRAYTAASLVVTALTGIVTSALTPFPGAIRAEAAIGIAGGVAGGALGVTALTVHATLVFRHPRNPLRDVWEGPERSALFPDVVWRYLSDPRFSDDHRVSIRANLVRAWASLGRLGRQRARRSALFFGDGGRYDADELDSHAAMINELRAAIELMEQELLHLATEVSE